jgi:hypothetical protein
MVTLFITKCYVDDANEDVVVKVSKVFTKIIIDNLRCTRYMNDICLQKELMFYNDNIPQISIKEYCERIVELTHCEEGSFIASLLYVDRVCRYNNVILTLNNIHKLLFTSIIISIKYNEDQIIYGTVTDGTNYAYCKKEVTITPNACSFTKIENSNNTTTVILNSINNPNAEYYIKDSTSNKWMYMNAKTISNNTKITIWGMVKVGNNRNYCVINFPDDKPNTCTDLYKPTEYSKIKNYCENNWQKDGKGYSSYNDCYTDCTNGTNTCKSLYACSDIKAIRQYCKVNYQVDGYKNAGNCINDCSCGSNGLKYYYRTISLNNPFPDREAHYNWIGYEEYITNDIEDNTPSTNSGGPEYEIVLDSKRINAIKKHTKKYISEGNDAYGDFIRASKKDTGKYKSKFIHVDDIEEGGFSTYFTYIEGSKTGG